MKLFASDYDGTIKREGKRAAHDLAAIRSWREKGNLFVIVSGRSMESLQEDVNAHALQADYYIGNNGGTLYDEKFQELKTYYIPYQRALAIMDYLKQANAVSYVVNDGYHRAQQLLNQELADKMYSHHEITYTLSALLDKQRIAQIVAVPPTKEQGVHYADYINTVFVDAASAYRNIQCVDIAPKGVSKATGIAHLIHHLGLAQPQVFTLGDSFNDIPMLMTYYGIAMAHAQSDIHQAAKTISHSLSEAMELAETIDLLK